MFVWDCSWIEKDEDGRVVTMNDGTILANSREEAFYKLSEMINEKSPFNEISFISEQPIKSISREEIRRFKYSNEQYELYKKRKSREKFSKKIK